MCKLENDTDNWVCMFCKSIKIIESEHGDFIWGECLLDKQAGKHIEYTEGTLRMQSCAAWEPDKDKYNSFKTQ